MTSEITWTWDGSAVARTSTLGAVWTVLSWRVGPAGSVTDHKRIELLDALVDSVETTLDPVRSWELTIKADCSGISAANAERKIIAGWEELAEAFDPTIGVAKLLATRKDTSGSDVSRYLLAEITSVPSYTPKTGEAGDGIKESGAYEGEGGYIIYTVRGTTVFPYWIGSALLNQDTAPADAELAISGSTDTVTIANASPRWVGVRLVVGSTSGSVTRITVANTTNGDSITFDNQGPLADGDYIDFLATDPRVVDESADTTYVSAGHTRLRLSPGSNTLQSTRGAGTGTCTLSVSWPSLDLSL